MDKELYEIIQKENKKEVFILSMNCYVTDRRNGDVIRMKFYEMVGNNGEDVAPFFVQKIAKKLDKYGVDVNLVDKKAYEFVKINLDMVELFKNGEQPWKN